MAWGIAAALAVAGLLAALVWSGDADAPALSAELAALRAEVAALRDAVDAGSAERRELAATVETLRGELARRGARRARAGGAPPGGALAAAAPDPAAGAAADPPAAEAQPRARTPHGGFDEEAMVAAGFDPELARSFRARMDEIDLERLYLRDEAARDGWLNTPRFKQENAALNAEMQETRREFGPDVYDWMLYAQGRPNRVAVTEVIAGSAADDAGIRAGDWIVGYGDERVFNANELRQSTLRGDPGETVPVDVLRDGEVRRINVPRGPLGVRMQPRAVRPTLR